MCRQQEDASEPKEKDALSKIIDLIHDEFAFDGYLNDGVEDVNMGEKCSFVLLVRGIDVLTLLRIILNF